MISIIILNWNGWKDTIECIESIYKSVNVKFSVLVVDNGSSDDSIKKIAQYVQKKNVSFYWIHEGKKLGKILKHRDFVLYELKDNYGFAKGNNIGLRLMAGQPVDYFWILNNDTIVKNNAIEGLQRFMDDNTKYIACTPQIRYFLPDNKIWNCGGKLKWGFRKYFYADKKDVVFKTDFFDISFITGCALFVRKIALNSEDSIFSENFFFGEEDFELSMRWKREKKKVACCTNSIIFHKVSASTQTSNELPKIFIHYLNRYIDIKQHFGGVNYAIWKLVNNIWISLLLLRKKYTIKTVFSFMSKLNKESLSKNGVEYNYFIDALNGKIL